MPAMMARSSRFIPTIAKRSSRDAEDLCVKQNRGAADCRAGAAFDRCRAGACGAGKEETWPAAF